MKRAELIILLALVFGMLLAPLTAEAQQPAKVYRIGILPPGPISARAHLWEAFRQGLRELGYVEGQNITLVFPSTEVRPERLREHAAELVSLEVDVIVAATTLAAKAATEATRTIPIVIPVAIPVETGLVAGLARPGGNTTGLALMSADLSGKRLELLKTVVPKVSRIAVLSNPTAAATPAQVRQTEVAARALRVQLQFLDVRGPDDFAMAFQGATKGRADALITLDDPLVFTHRTWIVKLAAKNRLPAIYGFREFVDDGGTHVLRGEPC